jgi:molecular chaperone DnaK
VFQHVASLIVPDASPDVLQKSVVSSLSRLATLRHDAKRTGAVWMLERIEGMLRDQVEAERTLDRAIGGDVESAQRAQRLLLDLDGRISELEGESRWPQLEERAIETVAWASSWVAEHGTPSEQKVLDDALAGMHRARSSRSVRDLERHRRVASRIGNGAFLRSPSAYVDIFADLASRVHEATDGKRADALVKEGRRRRPRRTRRTNQVSAEVGCASVLCCSPRRPCHRPPANHVGMQMIDTLTAVFIGV